MFRSNRICVILLEFPSSAKETPPLLCGNVRVKQIFENEKKVGTHTTVKDSLGARKVRGSPFYQYILYYA